MTAEAPTGEQHANTWRAVRRVAAFAYFTVLLVRIVIAGVPTYRLTLMGFVIAGLAVTCIGRGWRRLAWVVIDWLPFTLVLFLYDRSRGLATAVNLPVHERDIATAEKDLFGGSVPTVWLQRHFLDPTHIHWWDAAATLVYTTHFLATPILAALLWLRRRPLWLSYITRVVALAFAGLLTYIVFPEAPPWYAARDGVIAPVVRSSARGWEWLHVQTASQVLASAQADGPNPVAAMPSLHMAFATLVALFVASRIASRWRYLLYAYPAVMGLVLVYTAEHYVLDLVAGVLYAFVVDAAVTRWETSRALRREFAEAEPVLA